MEPTEKLKQAIIDYKNGSKDAFTILYEESRNYVYVCIYKIIKDCDNAPEAINDLMQDTYMEISRHISQLEKEERFLSWAGIIATRQCYAYLKKNRKYLLLSEGEDTLDKLVEDEKLIPEAIMQDREKQRLLREIIDTKLTPMQRLCVIAYYYNEQKQSEIASELGIPENTVKTNLSRAKAKIREGVLSLEKREGTRLYSVAPLLLLLLQEELRECMVPASTSKLILSFSMNDKIGKSATVTGKKVASMTLKAKITAVVIGVGILAIIGGIILIGRNQSEMPDQALGGPSDGVESGLNSHETELLPEVIETPPPEISYDSWPEWALIIREKLMAYTDVSEDAGYGFDLHDFDGDGIPELLIINQENLHIANYHDGSLSYGGYLDRYSMVDLIGEIFEDTYIYGYGMNDNEVIIIRRELIWEEGKMDARWLHITTATYAPDGKMTGYYTITKLNEVCGITAIKEDVNRDEVEYSSWTGPVPVQWTRYSEEEGVAALREEASCFNEIVFSQMEPDVIDERIMEFMENGNPPRTGSSEEEIDALITLDFDFVTIPLPE